MLLLIVLSGAAFEFLGLFACLQIDGSVLDTDDLLRYLYVQSLNLSLFVVWEIDNFQFHDLRADDSLSLELKEDVHNA